MRIAGYKSKRVAVALLIMLTIDTLVLVYALYGKTGIHETQYRIHSCR